MTNGQQRRRHERWLSLLVFAVGGYFLTVAGCARGSSEVERVPGTEWASSRRPAFTISPDERWLVFWEWMIDPRLYYKNEAEIPKEDQGWFYRLASVDLPSSAKTQHLITGLAEEGVLKRPYGTLWTMVGSSFMQSMWGGDTLYVNAPRGSKEVRVIPRDQMLLAGDAVPANLTCSDCPPRLLLEQRVEQLNGWVDKEELRRYSVAWSDGSLSERTYEILRRTDGATIVVNNADSTVSTVIDKRSRFKVKRVSVQRVSPDERYLAYVLWSKLKAPFPTPDHAEDVYVLNLETGKERLIAKHRFVGGLMWSPGGERLYFAGSGKRGDDPGIFVVSMDDVF